MLALLALFAVAQAPQTDSIPLLLGVLEEPQCTSGPSEVIRVLFTRDSTGWQSLVAPAESPVPRRSLTWFLAFDGHLRGTATTPEPSDVYFYWLDPKDRALELLDPRPTLPGNRDSLFTGWCGTPTRRPVVVLNRPNYADPEAWRPGAPAPGWSRLVLPLFRRTVEHPEYCPKAPDQPQPFRFRDQDVVVRKAYRSTGHRWLLALRLDPTKNVCEQDEETDIWAPRWFLLSPQPVYLGATLWLVDAGDYDADGRSELLFWTSSENTDGYVLYPGDGADPVRYLWHYH